MTDTLRSLDYSVLQQCMHCGMCLPTCPTYDTTKHERSSPRGRIALMRSIADGQLEVTPSFADEMSYCLGCLACQTVCPAGVDYARLFETARADIRQSGVRLTAAARFWRGVTLGGLFMAPRALRATGALLRAWQRMGGDAWARRMGLTRWLPADLARLEPQTPRIARAFSSDLIKPVETPATPRHRVALLTGCVQDLAFSDINRATADVLLENGCIVDTPEAQPCCGSLHAHNGETALARTLARRMLSLFVKDYDAIIVNAGGCGSHLRHYGHLLHDDPEFAERAAAWDAKVFDIHEWLIKIGCRAPTASPFDSPTVVTYHDSCHLAHGQRVVRQPRQVLGLLPGVTLVELTEAQWCCGSAGVYNITQPEESARQLARKIGHIRTSSATVLATANPGCHLQIARGLRDAGLAIEVKHPVSLLADAYRRERASSNHEDTKA